MKIDRREGSQSRRILIAMIVDRTVLSRVADKWPKNGLFPNDWCNLIGGWCVKHFHKYGTAPGREIQSRFERWAQNGSDKATTKLLSNFLSGLSDEYEDLAKDSNSEYIIDLAAEYFNEVGLRQLRDKIDEELEEGRVEAAQSLVDKFHRVEMGVGAGIDILHDREALIKAVEEHDEPLLTFPGALGEFFGNTLERDGFVAMMAPEKRGKTFWLMEFVWQGILQRRKVAYFQVGDMSQDQIMWRLMTRALGKPLRGGKKYQYPRKIQHDPESMFASVDLEERVSKHDADWQDVWSRFEEIRQTRVKSKTSTVKLSCHPNMSLTVDGLDSILDTWERQYEWTPDIIVVDYADIMAKDPGMDSRDGINMIWAKLRALSQSRHCLVITATQADAGSYSKVVINLSNFSEDKRKYSHVTAMAAINSSPDEKESGLQRLIWLVRREAMTGRTVHVAGCLDIANPAIRSCW